MRRFLLRLRAFFAAALLFLEDLILPPACLHCNARRWRALPLCRRCLRALRDARPEEDEAIPGMPWIRALLRLSPPLHALIHGFKYRHQARHIAFLGAWLRWRRAWIADFARTYDAFVPVPLHGSRRRERGFNQAERLAKRIGAIGARPVLAKALTRTRPTGTQTRLRRGERAENLEGVFRADARRVAGLRVLLIDDVCTTGSTLSHCRDALLAAGAARVDALVLAEVVKRVEREAVDQRMQRRREPKDRADPRHPRNRLVLLRARVPQRAQAAAAERQRAPPARVAVQAGGREDEVFKE